MIPVSFLEVKRPAVSNHSLRIATGMYSLRPAALSRQTDLDDSQGFWPPLSSMLSA
jgi:hypothetical protein